MIFFKQWGIIYFDYIIAKGTQNKCYYKNDTTMFCLFSDWIWIVSHTSPSIHLMNLAMILDGVNDLVMYVMRDDGQYDTQASHAKWRWETCPVGRPLPPPAHAPYTSTAVGGVPNLHPPEIVTYTWIWRCHTAYRNMYNVRSFVLRIPVIMLTFMQCVPHKVRPHIYLG